MRSILRTIVVVTLTIVGCGVADHGPDEDQEKAFPPYPWPASSSLSMGMDTAKTSAAIAQFRSRPPFHAFLVVLRDTLAIEVYNGVLRADNDYEMRSATKSFVSLLAGIAVDEGYLTGVQEKFFSILPSFSKPDHDPRKADITLAHLLTMRAGFDYVDGGRNSDVVAASSDWVQSFVDLPLLFDPGAQFAYSSPQTHLLSAVIQARTGMTTKEYAKSRLFDPLEISVRAWDEDPKGITNGGTGMSLTPRDMARFGQLLLHRGTIGGKTIVSEAWVDSSIVPRNSQSAAWGTLTSINYGYQWWLNTSTSNELFFAAGYGGQFILICPQKNLVVVTTAEPPEDPSFASSQESELLTIIDTYILPSVQ